MTRSAAGIKPGLFFPGVSITRRISQSHTAALLNYRRRVKACRRRTSRSRVHDLRVAIRRLMACLELEAIIQTETPGVRRLLLAQLDTLGALRNAQMQLKRIKSARSFSKPLAPLRHRLKKRVHRLAKEVLRHLRPKVIKRRLSESTRNRVGPQQVPGRARGIVNLIERKLPKTFPPSSGRALDAASVSELQHRGRVKAREYCFLFEILRPCLRRGATANLCSSLRAHQRIAGRIHDVELLLRRIDRLSEKGKLPIISLAPFRTLLVQEKTRDTLKCARLQDGVTKDVTLVRRQIRLLPAG